jgi:hypothetical protein
MHNACAEDANVDFVCSPSRKASSALNGNGTAPSSTCPNLIPSNSPLPRSVQRKTVPSVVMMIIRIRRMDNNRTKLKSQLPIQHVSSLRSWEALLNYLGGRNTWEVVLYHLGESNTLGRLYCFTLEGVTYLGGCTVPP